jgi:hypothetical protein
MYRLDIFVTGLAAVVRFMKTVMDVRAAQHEWQQNLLKISARPSLYLQEIQCCMR